VLAGVATGVALLVWPVARDAVRHHPYFTVREVVAGSHHWITAERLREVAGLSPGMSVWDVDATAAEAELLREPWIRRARVRRELPHRVVIHVREQRPVAILAAAGAPPALYYVAARGQVIAPVGPDDPRDFPYVTGLGTAELKGAFGARALRRALLCLRVAGRSRLLGGGAVSEVHVDPARGLTLLPTDPPVPVEIGWGRFEERLARLPEVMAFWVGREAELAAVSLVFDGEVVVRRRPPQQPAAPARRAART
jgi:cell division protein FtsQ